MLFRVAVCIINFNMSQMLPDSLEIRNFLYYVYTYNETKGRKTFAPVSSWGAM